MPLANVDIPKTSVASAAFALIRSFRVKCYRVFNSPKFQAFHPSSANQQRVGHKLGKFKHTTGGSTRRNLKTRKVVEPCIVYVGNIGPNVDKKALIAHFRRCGTILAVKIRCCGGVAMTVKPPPADYHENKRVRQYAIIVFGSRMARRRACKQSGTLEGHKLTVCVAISDLPEVREKITKRLDDYRARMEPPDEARAQKSALRSLKLDTTVELDARYEKEQRVDDEMVVWGLSMAKGIM